MTRQNVTSSYCAGLGNWLIRVLKLYTNSSSNLLFSFFFLAGAGGGGGGGGGGGSSKYFIVLHIRFACYSAAHLTQVPTGRTAA